MSDARLVTYARCSRLYSPGHRDISREYSRATTSGSSERAPRNPAFPTGGGDGGWGGRVVVRLGATRARPSRCAPRDGVLGIVALVASVLWHHLWQNASSRSGSTHAGRCDSSTLEYRTAELADETADLSHSLCDVCDGRNTPVGRSDRGNERGYAASQRHAYVMRKRGVCRAVPYRFASWWVATGADRGSGPARPPGHAAAFVCGPRGLRGSGYAIEAHTQVPRATARPRRSTAERSGGAFGVWGRTPGTGVAGTARTLHTRHSHTGIRGLQGFGRHGRV